MSSSSVNPLRLRLDTTDRVRPIEGGSQQHSGSVRRGDGDFEHRIEVNTNDELEQLAGQFNSMASQLHETYSDLEHKVKERTRLTRVESRVPLLRTGRGPGKPLSSPTPCRASSASRDRSGRAA